MNTLDAVNEALKWIGQPPVTALDAGGTTDEAEAQAELDAKTAEVLGRGWFVNEEKGVRFGVPTVKIGISAVTGTFQYAEAVTEGVTGAVGLFAYRDSTSIYLNYVSGTFTGGHTLTGGTSSALGTGGTYTAITQAKIAYPPAVMHAEPSATESSLVSMRGGFFFDKVNNTVTFSTGSGLTLDIIRLLDFDAIPITLQQYISKEAAWAFLLYKMPGRTEIQNPRYQELARARVAALQEDGDLRKTNLHTTAEALRLLGDRNDAMVLFGTSGATTGGGVGI